MINFYNNFFLNWCSVNMFNELPKEFQPSLKENVNCPVAHLLVLLVWEAWLTGTDITLICTDVSLMNFEPAEVHIYHNEIWFFFQVALQQWKYLYAGN